MFVCQGRRVKVKVTVAKSVSVCPARAQTFGCFDLQTSFLVRRIYRSSSSIKVMGQGQGHINITVYTHWRVVCV